MNLHSIVGPVIAAVNPMMLVSIRISVGQSATNPDGTRDPAYATPGALVGSIADNILTVTAVGAGKLQPGQQIAGAAAGTVIVNQLTGSGGGPGTYTISPPQTLASASLTAALVVQAQIQPLTMKDLMQLEGINQNGDKRAIYINGDLNGIVRVELKGGDLVELPNGQTWLVTQQLEGFNDTAGWTKCCIVLQDGA